VWRYRHRPRLCKRFIEEGAVVFHLGSSSAAAESARLPLVPISVPMRARVKVSVSDPADLDRLYAAVKATRNPRQSSSPMPVPESPRVTRRDHRRHIDEPLTPM